MKVVRLSALRTGRLYPLPPRKYSWYSLLLEAESTPRGHSAASRIMSMKNSRETIGNRTRDLPVLMQCLCSIIFFHENRVVYEMMWKNMVQALGDNTIRRMRIAWWKHEATDPHSEFVTFICFSTATMVSRKRLIFTLERILSVLLFPHFSSHFTPGCYM